MALTFLLGGARSGKSALAVRLAARWAGPVVFVATAEDRSGEMGARIARHRADRPSVWNTVEEPVALVDAIATAPPDAFVVVDCVSMWVANVLESGWPEEQVEQTAAEAAATAAARSSPVVAVSNEVGLGVVPVTQLGRAYRDVLGRANAAFASASETAYLVAAGRVLALSPPPA